MKIFFLEAAEYELSLAIEYYNQQKSGLGNEFLKEVKNTLKRIARFPEAWHQLSIRTRRCQTRRFPYSVVYQIRDEGILIVAISHLHQKPYYWQNRQ